MVRPNSFGLTGSVSYPEIAVALLPTFIYWEVLFIGSTLCVVVFTRLLAGGINTNGLLSGRNSNGELSFSPARVQLLLFTIAAAFQFVNEFLRHPTVFPQVSGTLLALFGSSHLVYLGGKIGAAFLTGRANSD
jgi:hypothetical protein